MDNALLRHGEFFGYPETQREVAGFALSIKTADRTVAVERHTHEDAHFILLLDGHYLSTARGAGHLHAEPALIYNPPGTTHRDTFPDRAGRFAGVSVSRERLAEASELGAPLVEAERIWEPAALEQAQRIAALVARAAPALAVEATCLELIGALVRGIRDERRPPRWLRRAREQLHDRAHDSLTVGEIARDASVHPVHLARAFRRFFGCTPAGYVRQVRVERAARMLRMTAHPIAEIAMVCGFVDQSHLNRAFARILGTSPAAYRRRYA